MAPRPTVHVIDDDDAVRDLLLCLLEAEGLHLQGYESAEAFLQGAQEPGCIVTDVQMPGMGGIGLLGELARRGIGIPVLMITGRSSAGLAAEARGLGVFRFIEKPFEPDDLVAAVHQAIASRGP